MVGICVFNFCPGWKGKNLYISQLAGEKSQIVPDVGGIKLILRDQELIRRCQTELALQWQLPQTTETAESPAQSVKVTA